MRILQQDARQNLLKLVAEVPDDLWHLANLIAVGDRVGAATYRTPEVKDDRLRAGKIEKQKMHLVLEVTDIEHAAFSDRLRIHGTIVEGPQELGAHHTFNVEADGRHDLSIVKPDKWPNHLLLRVKEAVESAKRPVMHIVAIEEGEATVAEVRQSGVREVATITQAGSGKQYQERLPRGADPREEFLGEVAAKIAQVRTGGQPLIVVGPGFTRESLIERLKAKDPQLAQGVVTEATGQAGMVGVHEAIKRGLVARVQQDAQVARDTERVESLLAEIGRDGKATYGEAEVARAIELGAVEVLLVTEQQVRRKEVERLMKSAEERGAEVHVVASDHDAGRKLEGLGGVAATLRYRLGE